MKIRLKSIIKENTDQLFKFVIPKNPENRQIFKRSRVRQAGGGYDNIFLTRNEIKWLVLNRGPYVDITPTEAAEYANDPESAESFIYDLYDNLDEDPLDDYQKETQKFAKTFPHRMNEQK